jgi:hypothetical protein
MTDPKMFSSLPPLDRQIEKQIALMGSEIIEAVKENPELADKVIAILDGISTIMNDADPAKQKQVAKKLAAIQIFVKETQRLGGAQIVGEELSAEGLDVAESVVKTVKSKIDEQMR